jgi:hypothetical protein
MIDPILRFPRVIHERRDPTTSDDRSEGIIEGNIWINIDTGRIFSCVNSELGTWVAFIVTGQAIAGADFSFGDGSADLTASFNLGLNGIFEVFADNIQINNEGGMTTDGNFLILNLDRETYNAAYWAYGYDWINYDPEKNKDGVIVWNPMVNSWQSGYWDPDEETYKYLGPLVNCVVSTRDPEPTDNFEEGHFVGQVWINMATQQKFTCFSCTPGEDAVWRLALTSAPTKAMVEYDDFIILYGQNDDTYMKISVNDFALFIQDAVGGLGASTAGYAFVLDGSDNITISEEDPITQGVFEEDGSGHLQPITGSQADVFFEFDINDDIQPKEA